MQQRRQRTASRIRPGGSGRVSYSPSTTAGSPLKRLSPDLFDPENSVHEADETVELDTGLGPDGVLPDESIRINYIDPVAEKQKRKLLAMIQGSSGKKKAMGEGSRTSPNKKAKRGQRDEEA